MNSHIDYAEAVLRKTRDDGYVVRRMSADAAEPDWIIGFHAQQTVEEAFKSVLTRQEIEFPQTHNLSMLIELLQQHGIAVRPDADDLPRLTPFGVALLYDDSAGEDEPTLEWAWAVEGVHRILGWTAA